MKLNFKDGYIQINQDKTLSIVGSCANTFYFEYLKLFRTEHKNKSNDYIITLLDKFIIEMAIAQEQDLI